MFFLVFFKIRVHYIFYNYISNKKIKKNQYKVLCKENNAPQPQKIAWNY